MYLFIVLFFLCLADPCFATPSISSLSGSFNNGSVITVSGSGFSTKSVVKPLVFDNLEDGDVTTTASTFGSENWTAVANQTISTTQKHSGTYSSYQSRDGSEASGHFYKNISTLTDSSKIYMSMWRRYTWASTPDNLNLKNFRIWALDGETYTEPDLATAWHGPDLAGYPGSIPALTRIVEGCDGGEYYMRGDGPSSDVWHFEEWIVQLSSGSNQADGKFYYRRDGTTKISIENMVTKCTAYPLQMARVVFDNYGSNYTGNIYMDDLYVDTVWNRVLIGDANTYAGSSHFEVQPPVSWGDGSLSFSVNIGSFGVSDTAYLYIVDSNGAVNSSGYPFTFGSTYGRISYGLSISGANIQ